MPTVCVVLINLVAIGADGLQSITTTKRINPNVTHNPTGRTFAKNPTSSSNSYKNSLDGTTTLATLVVVRLLGGAVFTNLGHMTCFPAN